MSRRAVLAAAFLSALTAVAAVPTPENHFGHPMGADRHLLEWSRVVSYFDALSKSSDRIRVRELGKSTEGRAFIEVTIAAPETLRDLDRYHQIQSSLADPRRLATPDAERLIRDGKTVVLITCSIHATEVASTQTAV